MHARIKTRLLIKALFVIATMIVLAVWATVSLGYPDPVQAKSGRDAVRNAPLLKAVANSPKSAVAEENACAACHEDTVTNFGKTVHGKLNGRGGGRDGTASCTACHGDPAAHLDDPSEPGSIKNPKKLKASDVNQTCMSCHAQMNDHSRWRGSRHESAGLSCINCHSPHHASKSDVGSTLRFGNSDRSTKLLKGRTEADTCYSCHSDKRKAQYQRSTHIFRNEDREKKINCSTCHEPHGSIGPKMMRTASLNETCYKCHTDKRGPFLWEHPSSTENCMNCHNSHGSNHVSLLKKREPMLCQQCHIQGKHQTVAGEAKSAFTFYRSCTNCHSQVHGSNHPSGIVLQR